MTSIKIIWTLKKKTTSKKIDVFWRGRIGDVFGGGVYVNLWTHATYFNQNFLTPRKALNIQKAQFGRVLVIQEGDLKYLRMFV